MNQSDHSRTSEDRDPDFLDPVFAQWNARIACSDEQVSRMWASISDVLVRNSQNDRIENRELTESSDRSHAIWFANALRFGLTIASLAAAVLIFAGLAWYGWRDRQLSNGNDRSEIESIAQLAFTSQELQESQLLACETMRLCNKRVLVRRKSESWDIDDDAFGAEMSSTRPRTSRLLIRTILQERILSEESQNGSWRETRRNEVITGDDQQLGTIDDSELPLQAWALLLQDDHLWTEVQDQRGTSERLLERNQPAIVWESSLGNAVQSRLVVIYELLESCDQEFVL